MQFPKRTTDLRKINRQSVLKELYFEGSMSRHELSLSTYLSLSTVTNVTMELLAEKIILETGSVESHGGRPRKILAINSQYGYFIGVEIGETHVRVELFDLTLKKLNTIHSPVPAGCNQPEEYVKRIVKAVPALLAQANITSHSVLGMGIGMPGMVETNNEIIVYSPSLDWKQIQFKDMLAEEIHLPIFIDNDAKAMALAETRFGAGKGLKNLAAILLGTGIGAGIITGGELYRGATNSAGEWGHTKVIVDGRACRCGSKGCLEAYAGAPGIIATLREIDPTSPILEGTDQAEILSQLVSAADQGDPVALKTLQTTTKYLAAGISTIINLFNPELIIIGGWVGLQLGSRLLPELTKILPQYALPQPLDKVRICLCQFGQDATSIGGASLALQRFLTDRVETQPVFSIPEYSVSN